MMTTDLTATEHVMPEADAHRLTERIRHAAMSVRDGVEKLQRLVGEAQEGNAHLSLGYASWTAYIADVMGDEPLRLPRDKRREVVAWLSGEGMSTRAIAPIVGANQATVVRDIAAGDAFASPTPEPPVFATTDVTGWDPDDLHEQQVMDEETQAAYEVDLANVDIDTGEIRDEPVRKITTLDGKTYTRPAPREQKPRRKSLPDVLAPKAERVWSDALELADAINDDRFDANRDSISHLIYGRVRHAALALTELIAELNPGATVETEEARDRLVADLNHISETFDRLALSIQEEPK